MNDQNESQQWTPPFVAQLMRGNVLDDGFTKVSDAHNAALISEKDWSRHLRIQLAQEVEKVNKLNAALAAEREQGVKALAERSFELHAAVEALKRIAEEAGETLHGYEPAEIANAALEKIGDKQ